MFLRILWKLVILFIKKIFLSILIVRYYHTDINSGIVVTKSNDGFLRAPILDGRSVPNRIYIRSPGSFSTTNTIISLFRSSHRQWNKGNKVNRVIHSNDRPVIMMIQLYQLYLIDME